MALSGIWIVFFGGGVGLWTLGRLGLSGNTQGEGERGEEAVSAGENEMSDCFLRCRLGRCHMWITPG